VAPPTRRRCIERSFPLTSDSAARFSGSIQRLDSAARFSASIQHLDLASACRAPKTRFYSYRRRCACAARFPLEILYRACRFFTGLAAIYWKRRYVQGCCLLLVTPAPGARVRCFNSSVLLGRNMLLQALYYFPFFLPQTNS
jgi:hypothetical protein